MDRRSLTFRRLIVLFTGVGGTCETAKMPQGLKALTSGNQQKLRHKKAHAKASSKAKAAKKGSK